MKANYKMAGKDRHTLIAAIEEITGKEATYLGMPTTSYVVDDITIDKIGRVSCDNDRKLKKLIFDLSKKGFIPKDYFAKYADCSKQKKEPMDLKISLPLNLVNVTNLSNLLTAKGALIKKALGIDSLDIEVSETCVTFPWFKVPIDPNEAEAYMHFVTALCKMSMDQKRVYTKEFQTDNARYAFRCFLLRLHFSGEDYKEDRRILLKRLSGSSAFRHGKKE